MVFTTEGSFEAAIECWSEWDLNPRLLNYVYLHLYLYLSIHLSIYLSIYLSIHPSIHPSIYPFIYLSIFLYLYISLYMCVYVCMCIKSHVRDVFILIFIWKYIFWNLIIIVFWRQFGKESSRGILLLLYSFSVWLSAIILNSRSTTSLTSRHPLDNVSYWWSHACSRWKSHSKIVEAKQCEFNWM